MGLLMDPSWISVGVAIAGCVGTGIVAYHAALRGTSVAIARGEERHISLKEQVVYLTEQKDEHATLLTEHGLRIGLLERGDQAPRDYAR